MSVRTTRCEAEACQAVIFWAETPYGKKQPIDAAPNPEQGNIVVVRHTYTDGQQRLLAFALGSLNDEKRQAIGRMGLHLRTAHHMTCPAREEFDARSSG